MITLSDDKNSEESGDTVIILSSELIAEVMEAYFNKVMFKKAVRVVDLKTTEAGYMFSLLFTPVMTQRVEGVTPHFNGQNEEMSTKTVDYKINPPINGQSRDKRGHFVSKKSAVLDNLLEVV